MSSLFAQGTRTIYDFIYNSNDRSSSLENNKLYDELPELERSIWTTLGDNIADKERFSLVLFNAIVPREKCYTLRLDIRSMSTTKRWLQEQGCMKDGWDPWFATVMCRVTERLARECNAVYAFTQSDEITIVVAPPPNLEDNPGFQHLFAGRCQKLISVTAGMATATLNSLLWENDDWAKAKYRESWTAFDCRIAIWDNLEDAFQTILWRSYDCSVNGLSSAVHGFGGGKNVTGKPGSVKLKWLEENGKLPLPDHQCYGALFYNTVQTKISYNLISGVHVGVTRSSIHKMDVHMNIINYVKHKTLPGLLYSKASVSSF